MKKFAVLMMIFIFSAAVFAQGSHYNPTPPPINNGHHTNDDHGHVNDNNNNDSSYGDTQYFQSRIRQKLSELGTMLRYEQSLKDVRKLRQLDTKLEDIMNWLNGTGGSQNENIETAEYRIFIKGAEFSTSYSSNTNKAFDSFNQTMLAYEEKIREMLGNRLVDFTPGAPEKVIKNFKVYYQSKDTRIRLKYRVNSEKITVFESTLIGDRFSTSYSSNYDKALDSLSAKIDEFVTMNRNLGKKYCVLFMVGEPENSGPQFTYQMSAKVNLVYITPTHYEINKSNRVITSKSFSTSYSNNYNEALQNLEEYFKNWLEREQKYSNDMIYVGFGPVVNVGATFEIKYQKTVEKAVLMK